jgi:ubiquinone biosynthesis protein Coq4
MKIYSKIKDLRSRLLVYLTHRMALPVLRIIRKPERFPYTREQLKAFPKGSLGKDLINFLEEKDLELLPYYARHDIKHILLGYDTTDEGEGCLQCFMLGNGHVSFPVIATVVYGFVTMPEYWSSFREAYARGRRSTPIADWKWFEILEMPTDSLTRQIDKPVRPFNILDNKN